MKLLVIVVTYNGIQWVERCFESLIQSTAKPDVFVVDNGSTDGTQAYIQNQYPKVFFYQSEINLGFGRANNIGLQYALDKDYDYVYLLNQDAWVLGDAIERMVECHQKNPEYGILSPMQLSSEMNSFDENFRNHTCMSLNLLTEDLFFGRPQDVYPVKSVMAAHWLISIECVKKVGGFSPTFQQYGEDDNYINRVHYHGMKIGIVPSAKAVHDRQYRKQTKEKYLFHHFFKYYLVLFSQPRKILVSEWMKMIYSNILSAYKLKSFGLIQYTFQLIKDYRQIRANRLSSMKDGAFLS